MTEWDVLDKLKEIKRLDIKHHGWVCTKELCDYLPNMNRDKILAKLRRLRKWGFITMMELVKRDGYTNAQVYYRARK